MERMLSCVGALLRGHDGWGRRAGEGGAAGAAQVPQYALLSATVSLMVRAMMRRSIVSDQLRR